MTIPELELSAEDSRHLASYVHRFGNLDRMEREVAEAAAPPFALRGALQNVRNAAVRLWREHDHLVIRQIPDHADGASLLAVAGLLCDNPKTYRGGRIVKRFRMSPWTDDLSHTLADGHFHTDINTAQAPPCVTLMQCLTPDPRAPEFGQLRVVRLCTLLSAVRGPGYQRIRQFLMDDEVAMVNDREEGAWRGVITKNGEIRFHPETLRHAAERYGASVEHLEECLQDIHKLLLALSEPIDLGRGDVLVVSNRRALHQRGPCTVRFNAYPRDFDAREVAVVHSMDEPS